MSRYYGQELGFDFSREVPVDILNARRMEEARKEMNQADAELSFEVVGEQSSTTSENVMVDLEDNVDEKDAVYQKRVRQAENLIRNINLE